MPRERAGVGLVAPWDEAWLIAAADGSRPWEGSEGGGSWLGMCRWGETGRNHPKARTTAPAGRCILGMSRPTE